MPDSTSEAGATGSAKWLRPKWGHCGCCCQHRYLWQAPHRPVPSSYGRRKWQTHGARRQCAHCTMSTSGGGLSPCISSCSGLPTRSGRCADVLPREGWRSRMNSTSDPELLCPSGSSVSAPAGKEGKGSARKSAIAVVSPSSPDLRRFWSQTPSVSCAARFCAEVPARGFFRGGGRCEGNP